MTTGLGVRPPVLGQAPKDYERAYFDQTVTELRQYFTRLNLLIANTPLLSTGTVTAIAQTVPAFLSVSGSPVTTTGTLAITYSGTALPVANGGTGVTTSTGTGDVVLSTSPTLVTPLLGTPTSGVATNLTGLPLTTGVTGTLPVANGGTGAAALTAYAPLFGGTTTTDPVQSGTVGTTGQVLTSNGAGALPTMQAVISSVTLFCPGAPTASQLIGHYACPAGITTQSFAAAIAGSAGKALTAATAETDLDVRKNATTSGDGTSVGTVRFAIAGTVSTFIAAAPFSLTGGSDWLTVWAPGTPDATLADIAVSLHSTLA